MSLSKLAAEIGELVERKNKNYGNSFGKTAAILRILYPKGVSVEQYFYLGLVIRMLDKISRISQGVLKDSCKDISGYGILGEYARKKGIDK